MKSASIKSLSARCASAWPAICTPASILVGARQLDKLADIMQREKVDIILLPGDLMDDNVAAYRAENMQPHLEKLRAPLGVYATLGNHDFFGHEREIAEELTRAGIKVLANESLVVDGAALVGRNDDLDTQRPSTAALLQGQNTDLPVLLLDHRPSQIDEHAKLPVEFARCPAMCTTARWRRPI